MEDGFRLQDTRIAIIGLGLMGGSLAMALKGKCAALFGIDRDEATLELAIHQQIVDQADVDPAKLLSHADLIILATPVSPIIDLIHKLPAFVQHPCIVFDLGSTKKDIVQAMASLPERFDPIGGHPICGREKLGLEHAEAGLFQNAAFVVTSLQRTTPRARTVVEQLILAIGARKIEMDAGEHDRALAATSHLPFMLASALALSTPQELAHIVGTGFKSTSRLAGTPAHMMMGILQSNRENILTAIRNFRDSLHKLETTLEGEDDLQLENLLHQSRAVYQQLITSN